MIEASDPQINNDVERKRSWIHLCFYSFQLWIDWAITQILNTHKTHTNKRKIYKMGEMI